MEKVCELFMESDKKGLEALYDLTKNELCKILLSWLNEYEEINEGSQTNEYYMYNDIVSYLWNKYNIGGKNE